MNVQMPDDLFLDTFVGDVPNPLSSTSNEIPQEGLYNQYSSETAKTAQDYTTPFIHSVNAGGVLVVENYTVPADVVIQFLNVSNNAGAFELQLNGAIIIDGAVAISQNFAIPNWLLRKGDIIRTTITNGGIHWLGIYLK